jgi:hypothetical protein
MNVTSKVTLNTANIKTLIEALNQSHQEVTYDIADDVMASKTVPYRTGKLEFTADVDCSQLEEGHTEVVFDTPYARRIYFNPDNWHIRQTYNANAQSMWMQTYIDGAKSDMPKERFAEYFKKYSKGVIK